MKIFNFLSGMHLARINHFLLIILFFVCIAVIYYYGLSNTFDNRVYFASGILFLEAMVLSFNRGRCPMEHIHRKFGDKPVFFEHFLDPKLSSFVIPAVIVITAFGFLALYI